MIDMLEQPEYIAIHSSLRLRKYDGQAHLAFSWYQNPDVIRLIDGSREPYTLQRIKKMYDYLTQHGEVYFISKSFCKFCPSFPVIFIKSIFD